MWVMGHSGVAGNEAADKIAGSRGGLVRGYQPEPEVSIPAGIRQAFPLHTRPSDLKWDREALRDLTYIATDRGPLRRWLWVIGRAEDDKYECGIAQNTAHLLRRPLVRDGKGRSLEEARQDPELCREVARFLRR